MVISILNFKFIELLATNTLHRLLPLRNMLSSYPLPKHNLVNPQKQLKQNDLRDQRNNPADDISNILLLLRSTSNANSLNNSNNDKYGVTKLSANDSKTSKLNDNKLLPLGKESQSNCKYVKSFTIDNLRKYFHLPLSDVAKVLKCSCSVIKRVCRANNIKKWPYRQIDSIKKNIVSLQMAAVYNTLNDIEREKNKSEIKELQRLLHVVMEDPTCLCKCL